MKKTNFSINFNTKRFKKVLTAAITISTLVACCPRDGTDRSSFNNDYNVAMDFSVDNQLVDKNFEIPTDYKIKLLSTDNKTYESLRITKDTRYDYRYIFYYDSNLTDEKVKMITLNLLTYDVKELDFQSLSKENFQRDPVEINDFLKPSTKNSFLEHSGLWNSLCFLHPIVEFILPSAQAFSCKTKDGSKVSFRQGVLIKVDLTPTPPSESSYQRF